ncbi:nucleotidyltransferase family protein [Brevundimonas sp.]|uniref:nucleotidyltransferase family protein n=1 Tax=Brevundimonas sp. TaxID=1871086 RepID=UPI001A29926A|nr:nucleotidyltransferase family protein [Brevundimonas sp.]MBJ7483590.1 nucleotidyltransferase family protein [Brevundimonas sp.]
MSRPGDISGNLLGPDDTLLTAIERMDGVRRKLLVVVDEDRHLLGTLTDGDIRRGLMRRIEMDAAVRQVMNLDPVALRTGGSEAEAVRRLSDRGVQLAPMLDAEERVIGLYPDAIGISATRDTLVVIMAGGRGVRLAPLTQNCPKPMLKVAGRPLLETIIERLRDQGFWRFRLAVNYLAEMIEDHFGDGSAMGIEIRYLREDHPRGTAGALALLEEPLDGPMLVMNGDLLTRMSFSDLIDFHTDLGAQASLCVREHAFQAPHGVAEIEGSRLVSLREKPTFRWQANAGVYCLDPSVLARVPAQGPYDMPELLAALAADGETVGAYPIHEYWLDIGRPPDFENAQTEFGAVFA